MLRISCAASQSCECTRSFAHLRASEWHRSLSPANFARLAAVFSDVTSPFLAMTLAASKPESAAR